ncbi:hypothetical protein ACFE04_000137 [Oxalis oulophora]
MAASTSPPVLPVSNNPIPSPAAAPATVPAVTTTQTTQTHIATPTFRSFIANINESVRNGFSERRPWLELADRSAFSKPESLAEASMRVRKNYTYFRVNYLTITTAILAFSLLTNPFSLFLLSALLASWLFLYVFRSSDQPIVLFGRPYTDRETLGILIVASIVVLFMTSVGSVLISAVMIGLGIVCAHGSFRVPEDLFMDEQSNSSSGAASSASGFLNLIGGAATNAAVAATVRV